MNREGMHYSRKWREGMGNKFGIFVYFHFYFYQVLIDVLHHHRPVVIAFLSQITYFILRKQCTISVEENY